MLNSYQKLQLEVLQIENNPIEHNFLFGLNLDIEEYCKLVPRFSNDCLIKECSYYLKHGTETEEDKVASQTLYEELITRFVCLTDPKEES